MRKRCLGVIPAIAACALVHTAAADDLFRYNYIDLGYTKVTADVPSYWPQKERLYGVSAS